MRAEKRAMSKTAHPMVFGLREACGRWVDLRSGRLNALLDARDLLARNTSSIRPTNRVVVAWSEGELDLVHDLHGHVPEVAVGALHRRISLLGIGVDPFSAG